MIFWCYQKFTSKNANGQISRVLELSYINKSLVERAEISLNQAHPQDIDMPVYEGCPESKFEILINPIK